MNKGIGLTLLGVGMALIIYGFSASDAVSKDLSRVFAGAPTAKTMCLLLGGSAAAVVGVTLTFHRSGKT